MTNKEKKFELLFETLEGKRTGRKVSDHIKQVAKDIYLGTSSHTCMDKYQGNKQVARINQLEDLLYSWMEYDPSQCLIEIQKVLGKGDLMQSVYLAVDTMYLEGKTACQAARIHSTHAHNVKAANQKLVYFNKAAKEYRKLL
jgi:hypothetical protein